MDRSNPDPRADIPLEGMDPLLASPWMPNHFVEGSEPPEGSQTFNPPEQGLSDEWLDLPEARELYGTDGLEPRLPRRNDPIGEPWMGEHI